LRYRHFPAGGDIGEHTLDKAQAQLEEDFPPQACGRVPWAHKGMRLRCNRTAIKSIVEPEYRAARHALVHVHGPAHCIAPTMQRQQRWMMANRAQSRSGPRLAPQK